MAGLHLAVYQGDGDAITRPAAEGADLDARDRAGRTPAHVADFASNGDALRALAVAGADMSLLDGELFDVVTIAAVANDPEMLSLAIKLGNRADLIASRHVGTSLIAAADAKIGDNNGVTPLRRAETRGYSRNADLIRAKRAP